MKIRERLLNKFQSGHSISETRHNYLSGPWIRDVESNVCKKKDLKNSMKAMLKDKPCFVRPKEVNNDAILETINKNHF